MNWLEKDAIMAWYGLLPEDIASCMEKPDKDVEIDANDLASKLTKIQAGNELVDFISSNSQEFEKMGRPRRIRFLAWLAGSNYPDKVQTIQILTDDDSAGGSRGDVGKIAPYFKEDIRALVESLGPRVAKHIVNGSNLNVARDAGFEASNEITMGA